MRQRKGSRAARRGEMVLAGQTIPAAAMRRALIHMERQRNQFDTGICELYRTAVTVRAQRSKRKAGAAEVARTLAAKVSAITAPWSGAPVAAPSVARRMPDLVAGSYSLRVTPTYPYGELSDRSPITQRNSLFVSRNTGQMRINLLANRGGDPSNFDFSVGDLALGAFFIPMFGPARLQATIAPEVGFAWWTTGSLAEAVVQASLWYTINAFRLSDGVMDGGVVGTPGPFPCFIAKQSFNDEFEWGAPTIPMSAELQVNTSHFYLIQLLCWGSVVSNGTPPRASTADLYVNLNLPHIDLDVQWMPVNQL